jgi:SPP1 gp7 family putative phage head morphogenesis protein
MSNYWTDRKERELNAITNKTQAEINAQLNKYYKSCMNQVIDDFIATYNKLIATVGAGNPPTVADLYKLDRYWQMQARLKEICQALGDKEVELLSKKFEAQWQAVYEHTALVSDEAYTQVSTSSAEQMAKSVWATDGKSFSDRIWSNTAELVTTLNEKLIHCVVTGRSEKDLRNDLMERFGVSRSRANTLIRTETARIQTESAAQRYKDDGLEYYTIRGREEHDHCGSSTDCRKMDGKKFLYSEMVIGKNAPPFHPNCRCRIVPVVNNDLLRRRQEEVALQEREKRAKQAEAKRLKEQADGLRAKARALKKEGRADEAKILEAEARALEKQYKELYASIR